MSKRRCAIEQKACLLENILTHPQYGYSQQIVISSLQTDKANKFLQEFFLKGYIEYASNSRPKRFRLTTEGIAVLKLWRKAKEALEAQQP